MAGPSSLKDIKNRAGLLLYRQLPEEYRFQDRPPEHARDVELGHLEAYLHSFGHLLDLIRGTTEQAHADSFAEPLERGFVYGSVAEGRREIQGWLLPYLAELVGAELLAPNPIARRKELSDAVLWAKMKGTAPAIDAIADAMTGLEVVIVEGWKRTLVTPRMSLPPFSVSATAELADDPLGPSPAPLGTPDLRTPNRAISDASGANPLFRLRTASRDPTTGRKKDPDEVAYWKPLAPTGAPCFPNAFDDVSARTPDVRDPETQQRGPHPRRIQLHIRPPTGLFEKDLLKVDLARNPIVLKDDVRTQRFTPETIWEPLGREGPAPDKLILEGDLVIPPGLRVAFTDLLFLGRVSVPGAQDPPPAGVPTVADQETRLQLRRCAVNDLRLGTPGREPTVVAEDCLFQTIFSASGFAQLVHCTVLGQTRLDRLWASDCVFAGDLIDIDCGQGKSCVRFSAAPNLSKFANCGPDKAPSNRQELPRFVTLWFHDPARKTCEPRAARFGEPGTGVLDLSAPEAIRLGAENGGEMGVGNHLFYSASVEALLRKLGDFLPLGQEAVARYDNRLAAPVARVKQGNTS